MTTQKLISLFLEKNYLVSNDLLDLSAEETMSLLGELPSQENLCVLSKETLPAMKEQTDWFLFDKQQVLSQREPIAPVVQSFPPDATNVKVTYSYAEPSQKRTVQHFVHYFGARYKQLERLLHTRLELHHALSFIRIQEKKR